MKTIEQLLELSQNPYYKFTDDERVILDDFLSTKKGRDWLTSRKKNSQLSDKNTPVRVRNIVEKTVPDVETVA